MITSSRLPVRRLREHFQTHRVVAAASRHPRIQHRSIENLAILSAPT
jgi:hypothetical protein